MDYYELWSEYQRLRVKYPTDDTREWSTRDQQRANEIMADIGKMSRDEMYASMFLHVQGGAQKESIRRKLIRFLLGGGRGRPLLK